MRHQRVKDSERSSPVCALRQAAFHGGGRGTAMIVSQTGTTTVSQGAGAVTEDLHKPSCQKCFPGIRQVFTEKKKESGQTDLIIISDLFITSALTGSVVW